LPDNAGVLTRRLGGIVVAMIALLRAPAGVSQHPVGELLARALRDTQASAVVMDIPTGAVIASAGGRGSATLESAPGSALKPVLLEYALDHGIVTSHMEVYCRRNLHVGGRALPCTHPADNPIFTAQRALAESCNTWFAAMARRFTGAELEAALSAAGIPHAPMQAARIDRRQLAVLGLSGVKTSPLQLARAYAQMIQHAPPDGPVVQGLQDSVNFGMANPAAVKGVQILGKTGTASDPGEAWTHGWFAGALPGRLVLVVYVPHGDGGTAARLAQRFFAAFASERTAR
jgi:membrane peptidoglycan carboxypeptidase